MSLLQETCDAITERSHEIEQHIIDSWNAGSPCRTIWATL